MGPGRLAQADWPSPVQGPFAPSFALAAIRAIYSPGVESHTSSDSSSATEEQRREGHHPGEERVELVSLADVGTLHGARSKIKEGSRW
jgi:hypothetical protein